MWVPSERIKRFLALIKIDSHDVQTDISILIENQSEFSFVMGVWTLMRTVEISGK